MGQHPYQNIFSEHHLLREMTKQGIKNPLASGLSRVSRFSLYMLCVVWITAYFFLTCLF